MVWEEKRTLQVSREIIDKNDFCFYRKDHKCEKIFGGSKSCFIACPTDSNIKLVLDLLQEKLFKYKIEPVIAVQKREYGQDILCAKICGKILESKFCVVILDDFVDEVSKSKTIKIPNPNVYYEYGMMTTLGKHIIPLQRDDMDLAFNIRGFDTVKYNATNLSEELDKAIKNAIDLTILNKDSESSNEISERTILRKFELAGLTDHSHKKKNTVDVNDTNFRYFSSRIFRVNIFVCKIDTQKEIESHLEDLALILHRWKETDTYLQKEIYKLESDYHKIVDSQIQEESIKRQMDQIEELKKMGDVIFHDKTHNFIGVIFSPEIDRENLKSDFEKIIRDGDFTLSILDGNKIQFGHLEILL